MDSLIAKIQLSKNEAINDRILENNEIENSFMNIDDKLIAAFDDKKDFKLAKALKEALSVTSPNPFNEKSAFHIGLSINKNNNENND